MLQIRSRDEMKRHLEGRLTMLRAQLATANVNERKRISRHMDGICEAIQCIDAWERHEASATKDTQPENDDAV